MCVCSERKSGSYVSLNFGLVFTAAKFKKVFLCNGCGTTGFETV